MRAPRIASIKQATATTNFGNATTLEADGDDGSGVDKSALVRWTLSGIPAGSIVQSASITLRNINESNNTYNVYELLPLVDRVAGDLAERRDGHALGDRRCDGSDGSRARSSAP